MSTFVDVLELFVEAAQRPNSMEDYEHLPRHFVDAAWANGATSSRRAEVRQTRAKHRPPCPHCGAAVERVGASAKLPTYCAPKCSRAARNARWQARHGAARNDARRKTERRVGPLKASGNYSETPNSSSNSPESPDGSR